MPVNTYRPARDLLPGDFVAGVDRNGPHYMRFRVLRIEVINDSVCKVHTEGGVHECPPWRPVLSLRGA